MSGFVFKALPGTGTMCSMVEGALHTRHPRPNSPPTACGGFSPRTGEDFPC
jgi:hypothetical protein